MTAITAAPPAGARGRRRRSSSWTIMPATYLASIVILGLTVVPLLYVFLDGARSTAQISAKIVECRVSLSMRRKRNRRSTRRSPAPSRPSTAGRIETRSTSAKKLRA